MDSTHKIRVPDVAPKMPAKRPGEPDAFYEKRVNFAWEKAIAEQAASADLRERLLQLERDGYLAIISDPSNFLIADAIEVTDDEREALTAVAIEKQAAEAKKLKKAVGR